MTIAERPVGSTLLARCQRPTCNNIARLSKTGKPTKYCSDNCRMRVADDAYRARQAAAENTAASETARVAYEAEQAKQAAQVKLPTVSGVDIKARRRVAHKGQVRWLAQAIVDGKTIYGYALTEDDARAKVQKRLDELATARRG